MNSRKGGQFLVCRDRRVRPGGSDSVRDTVTQKAKNTRLSGHRNDQLILYSTLPHPWSGYFCWSLTRSGSYTVAPRAWLICRTARASSSISPIRAEASSNRVSTYFCRTGTSKEPPHGNQPERRKWRKGSHRGWVRAGGGSAETDASTRRAGAARRIADRQTDGQTVRASSVRSGPHSQTDRQAGC